MENRALEFHDSDIERIQQHRGEITLIFNPAIVHSSPGKPALDAGKVWTQKIRLRFNGADLIGDASVLPAKLADGKLIVRGQSLYLLPIPYETKEEVILKLVCGEEGEVEIRGEELRVEEEGEAEYLEDFP